MSDIDEKIKWISKIFKNIASKLITKFDDSYCYNYLYILKYILIIYDFELIKPQFIITKYLFKSLFNKILDEINSYQIESYNYNEFDEDTGELIRDRIKDNYYITQYYIEFINPYIIDVTLEVLNQNNKELIPD